MADFKTNKPQLSCVKLFFDRCISTPDRKLSESIISKIEVQSHHWNAHLATIHPFVIYYKNGEQIEHLSFVVISEDLRHDSIAVNLFASKIIEFFR